MSANRHPADAAYLDEITAPANRYPERRLVPTLQARR